MTNEEKRTIADLRTQGLGYTKIAQNLGMSVNTIKSYCRRNLSGLNASDDHAKELHFCKNCGYSVII